MANTYFEFKEFKINQENTAMKVGTDGVLLGAWIKLDGVKPVLDIGTGTGLISLMVAQRNQQANITGIEIDEQACEQAKQNALESPWASRISFIHQEVQSFQSENKFDLIVSNPPFFVNSHKAPSDSRNFARHTDSLSFDDLIQTASQLLSTEGRLALVYPAVEAELFIAKAKEAGLFINRICKVFPTPTKPVRRYLMEFSFSEKDIIMEELIVEMGKRHDYSPEYIALTKDFYLKF